jgi:hypothetical protein
VEDLGRRVAGGEPRQVRTVADHDQLGRDARGAELGEGSEHELELARGRDRADVQQSRSRVATQTSVEARIAVSRVEALAVDAARQQTEPFEWQAELDELEEGGAARRQDAIELTVEQRRYRRTSSSRCVPPD